MPARIRSRRALWPYLLLNILVSAAATLAVLVVWDHYRGCGALPALGAAALTTPSTNADGTPSGPTSPAPTAAVVLPPINQPVIEIVRVVAAGDLNQEVLTLRRLGDGDLHMAGWRLFDEGGNSYVFPQSPELVLFKDGALQIYTKSGSDTSTEVYWNRDKAVWESTELVSLEDSQGNLRATYRVP